ncbi:hypothetical protein [Nocardioides nitrophenolicus]|uniref:hypothetical protein n=1 Tax=Nocardioides nitrophenolicus TaxID=60489 RepID=UPI00195A9D55|nr:hypothetical protein [Nocardioides nitrophenolicus]MBM7519160.1 hypothetical protein [Nocardioides nitrophenolicus]
MNPSSLTRRLLGLALVASGLVGVLTATTAAPASAAARISVTNDRGTAAADTKYRTELTIKGTGFQVVKGGFGGVYLMFGWVDDARGGSWKPSKGGVTGSDYRYIPDGENAATNQGYLKFIAFPGSSTATEANAVLGKNGSFTVTLTVPGPTFQSVDRTGKVSTVDCTKVTCGVITIGAHGVKSPANETFTPVRFTDVYEAAPAGPSDAATPPQTTDQSGTAPEASGSAAAAPEATAPEAGAPAAAGAPTLTTDRLTAKVGNTLAFTATGFRPGEQVLGVLDDGVAGIGPMIAGPSGEVAGILPLPADLAAGTHELRLTGAATGGQATERFAVRPADATPGDQDAVAADSEEDASASRVFLVLAGCLFLLALGGLAVRLLLRRRTTAGAAA